MPEITEAELELAVGVFMREWAKIYPKPCSYPGIPLGHAIEAVLASREKP